jgi:hypothetical protein
MSQMSLSQFVSQMKMAVDLAQQDPQGHHQLVMLRNQIQRMLDLAANKLWVQEYGAAKALGHVGNGRFNAKL